jgi:hypothetical protein
MLVEKRSGLWEADGLNMSCSELEGKRHAVQPSTDACDDARSRIADVGTKAAGRCTLHEQLGCRKPVVA